MLVAFLGRTKKHVKFTAVEMEEKLIPKIVKNQTCEGKFQAVLQIESI